MKITQKVRYHYKGLNPRFPRVNRGLLSVIKND